MRIVLIGDIHVYTLWPRLRDLLSKRILGQMNLWFNRRNRFDLSRWFGVVGRIESLSPDLLLCPGDLATTATPSEFELAQQYLRMLTEKFDTFIVPGNHDRYTFTAARTGRFEQHFAAHTADRWPYHRPLGNRLHLVGLDATRANIIFDRGELGDEQLHALRSLIESLPPDDRLIVMCHYTPGMPPTVKPEPSRHSLIDLHQLLDVLNSSHPTLYLHGHVHNPMCQRLNLAPNVVAVNAGAPLMTSSRYPAGQGLWQIDFADQSSGTNQPWCNLTRHIADNDGIWQADAVVIPDRPGRSSAIASATVTTH